VQERSFSAAARDLGLVKSAVSKRISLLEERLGVRLLTRTTRKLSLTEDGARFYEHCAALLAAADAAEEAVAGASSEPRGRLLVNAPVSFAQMYLTDALAGFLRKHPSIEVDLSADDRMVDVVEGGFDVVVRITRLADSSMVARRLSMDRLVVCASPDYLARHGRPETPAELVGHNCLHYSLVSQAGEWRFRDAQKQPFVVPIAGNFRTTDGATLWRAALAGVGIAVTPLFMVARDVQAGRLELLLEGARKAEIGIYAMFASRRQLPARTKLLVEHLVGWFAEPAWRLR
ncbi:MAG TPA: LysR family transcriptional regulator, partial [Kofleriaceae bacterium]|nr:LysR family transcriptional regulator [Kofleriaceae bacterium]